LAKGAGLNGLLAGCLGAGWRPNAGNGFRLKDASFGWGVLGVVLDGSVENGKVWALAYPFA